MNENPNPTPAASGVDFDNIQGESFVGLNLLKLEVNQADGPFVIQSVAMKKFGEGSRAKELPQVIALKGNTPYTMPIAASFVARFEDASIGKGDSFVLKRTNDYTSQEGTEGCHSYILKVTARANDGKKDAAKK